MKEEYLIGTVCLICLGVCQALTKGTSWRGTLFGMMLGLLVGAGVADGYSEIDITSILFLFLFPLVHFGTLGTAVDASLRRHSRAIYCWITIVICFYITMTVPHVD